MWDISIYVKKEFGSFLPMLEAFNDAVAGLGYKFKKEYVKYHALIFTLNRAD